MGMVYTDYEIRSKVIAFNKASDKYRIRMIEYYEYNNEADWNAGQKMFNNDIITSNAPDIIVINSGMPVDSFMDKGRARTWDAWLAKWTKIIAIIFFVLVFAVLVGMPCIYILYEMVVLTALLFYMRWRHERMCDYLYKRWFAHEA